MGYCKLEKKEATYISYWAKQIKITAFAWCSKKDEEKFAFVPGDISCWTKNLIPKKDRWFSSY